MSHAPDLNWNEILIVGKSDKIVSCWSASRRQIESFNDPRMWNDISVWPEYFTKQPDDTTWGFCGYGIIAVDMDRKVSWSLNDYSTPTSLCLPNTSLPRDEESNPPIALRQLLAHPDHWDEVSINLRLVPGFGKMVEAVLKSLSKTNQPDNFENVVVSFEQLLPKSLSMPEAEKALTIDGGVLKWHGQEWFVRETTCNPKGWTNHNDRGCEADVVFFDFLNDMKTGGFPAPDWDNLKNEMSSFTEDMDEEDAISCQKKLDKLAKNWSSSMIKPLLPKKSTP